MLVFSVCVAATIGDVAFAQSPADGSKQPTPKKDPDPPPIAFFLAKGEADICGPGCREWIAADGTIDPAAAPRLRAFLTRLGKRQLPI